MLKTFLISNLHRTKTGLNKRVFHRKTPFVERIFVNPGLKKWKMRKTQDLSLFFGGKTSGKRFTDGISNANVKEKTW